MRPGHVRAKRRFRGEPAVELVGGRSVGRLLPGARHDGRVVARTAARNISRLPGGSTRCAPVGHGGLAAARAVGEPPLAAALPRRGRDGRPRRLHAAGRRQRSADSRVPRRAARLDGRPAHHAGARPAQSRASIVVDAAGVPVPASHRGHRGGPGSVAARRHDDRSDRAAAGADAFGWHPYLRLPGGAADGGCAFPPRQSSRARRPRDPHRRRRGPRPAERESIGRRTFDDGYALGRDRRLAIDERRGRGRRGAVWRRLSRSRRSGCRPASRSSRSNR